MPSEFFERLVQDRREGIAPPQQTPEPEPELPPVTFSPLPAAIPLMACRCGAAVPVDRTPNHAAWHAETGT